MGLIKLRLIITGGIFGSNSIAFTKNKTSERGQKNISQFLKNYYNMFFYCLWITIILFIVSRKRWQKMPKQIIFF